MDNIPNHFDFVTIKVWKITRRLANKIAAELEDSQNHVLYRLVKAEAERLGIEGGR